MDALDLYYDNKSKTAVLKEFISEKFNDVGNMFNGTYWKIQRQRDNLVEYQMYSLLEEQALAEGNKTLAHAYQLERENKCYPPAIDDPSYAGSHREAQDKFDAQVKADELSGMYENDKKRREAGLPELPFGLEWDL